VSLSFFRTEPHFISVAGEDFVNVPISDLRPGDAEFASYQDRAGNKIRFLLTRDSNGRIHAAFDACQHCYAFRRGYAVSHGELICKFCGNHYKLEAMDSGVASCIPVKLSFQIAGHVAKIMAAELQRGRQLF
jgi:uncharacterized membrane protein